MERNSTERPHDPSSPPGASELTAEELPAADDLPPDADELWTTMAARCRDAAGADATGVLVVTTSMQLEVVARSADAAPYVAVLEMQTRQGPCVDSYRLNRAVANHDLARPCTARRWPLFAAAAATAGLRGADAVPMRVGHRVVGALSLLRCDGTALGADTLSTVQAIADRATIELLRTSTDRRRGPDLVEQSTRPAGRSQAHR